VRLASNLLSEGLDKAQLQLTDTVLALPGLSTSQRAATWHARSLALARQARWSQALEAAETYALGAPAAEGALHGLRLSTVAAALGLLSAEATGDWAGRLEGQVGLLTSRERAESEWLLGVAEWAAGEGPSPDRQERLEDLSNQVSGAPALAESLEWLSRAAKGDSAAAGLGLLALVDAGMKGERDYPGGSPFFDGLVRLLAARWVAEADPASALRILRWHETILPDEGPLWMRVRANRVLEPIARAARARLGDASV
jgi:hypothetical protein